MATPNEKLAASLSVLKGLQDQGITVFRASAHPELTRVHRERLVKANLLKFISPGWYLPNNPTDGEGDSTHWYANMEAFIAAYATGRFGRDWEVSPELSLLRHSGYTSVGKQIVIHALKANNQLLQLPHGCSVFLYQVKRGALATRRTTSPTGLLLISVAEALVRVGPAFFEKQPLAAQIVLRQVDLTDLIAALLVGGHSVISGRMAGALRVVGRAGDADNLIATLKAAGYVVTEVNPFEKPLATIAGRLDESPYVQRIRAMWASMREPVVARFADIPRQAPTDVDALIRDISARYVADAYHSLSIEGYRVSAALIEKVRAGDWSPLTNPEDRQTQEAMAAKGYEETHKRVRALIAQVVENSENAAESLQKDFFQWYVTLFSPSVAAGILKPEDLAGYRNSQVFIRNALHVPLSAEAVRQCMPTLFELLATEVHPGVRAVLGHFIFVFIHPYMDGNGRLSRFLMNALLTTGGYPWTIVTVQSRKQYLAALEQASTYGNIVPFAELICGLVETQAAQPLERITQRPESGDWTAPPTAKEVP
ncbi:Fic family protein [Paraburkholderia sp. BCC1885]|uniref:Fic family protein n=1 Tax=Paraburkholderia sp. BCC1885 TaxID=2562669 RepID=UPI0011834108|nr:Fic family protein [Paraburkholderia sp. BCC1885]